MKNYAKFVLALVGVMLITKCYMLDEAMILGAMCVWVSLVTAKEAV